MTIIFYERTRRKTWCMLEQIKKHSTTDWLLVCENNNTDSTVYNIVSFIIYLGSTSAAGNDVKAGSPATSPFLGWKTSIMLSFLQQMYDLLSILTNNTLALLAEYTSSTNLFIDFSMCPALIIWTCKHKGNTVRTKNWGNMSTCRCISKDFKNWQMKIFKGNGYRMWWY